MALSEAELQRAADECANEPVHQPGQVQGFSVLFALEAETGAVKQVSGNTEGLLGLPPEALFGASMRETLGVELWHALKNAMARRDVATLLISLGVFDVNDRPCAAAAFRSGDYWILEIEPDVPSSLADSESFETLQLLMHRVQGCQTQSELFRLTCQLLRYISGYDRVMVYRFDTDYNGVVLAEDCKAPLETFEGLHFPHWDIPAQARAIMAKVPLRFVEDTSATGVSLVSERAGDPPIDITLARSRGVSPIHLEYLRNMGSGATLTLSIVLNGSLWGMISFHHRRRKLPEPSLRLVLTTFIGVFSAKLETLLQKEHVGLLERIDALKEQVQERLDDKDDFHSIAPTLLEILQCDGIAVTEDGKMQHVGDVPRAPLLQHLMKLGEKGAPKAVAIGNIDQTLPDYVSFANGYAGALVVAVDPGRTLFLFREEASRSISWAGNPDKSIDVDKGTIKLTPRGSFASYLEETNGFCKEWTDQDVFLAERVWTLINTVQRRAVMTTLNRQQKIMIEELNHRVRNILALVRSVSKKAERSSYGSLGSYSRTLEARIQALAASHELAAQGLDNVVPIARLLRREFDPFIDEQDGRVSIKADPMSIRGDLAPILSLVIHELVTNAVKYGALSNTTGQVDLQLERCDDGAWLTWQERGGPTPKDGVEPGFGTALITQAVPHELNGTTKHLLLPEGVRAEIFLPIENLTDSDPDAQNVDIEGPILVTKEAVGSLKSLDLRCALVVEDNYVIADGLSHDLTLLGVQSVEIAPSVEAALDLLEDIRPDFAVLDVNMGRGQTSEPVALRLLDMGVPFFMQTGYGELIGLDPKLTAVQRLTKPATLSAICQAIKDLFPKDVLRETPPR